MTEKNQFINPFEISKHDAWFNWRPHHEEISIPINKRGKDFQFTRKWFRLRNQTTFSTFLPKQFDGSKPINLIQIGVFEAMDLVWQLQNTAKHPDSRVLAIDPWMRTTKIDQDEMNAVHNRAKHNLRHWKDQVKIERSFSENVLTQALKTPVLIGGKTIKAGEWDLIVIDGDHDADPVLMDALLSLELCKVGGLLVFDDVRNRIQKKDHVQAGLNRFIETHGDCVELAWQHRFCDAYTRVK